MITRDPQSATRSDFDLIVIGAGIYGISLTLEAARRGLRPLLVEARDFGGETSWNSLRIVHGGLRYLQSMDLRRFRQSVVERKWFLRHFPDLVRPTACLMPLYGEGLRRPSIFRIALHANNSLSLDRNLGVPIDSRLPRGRILSLKQTLERLPAVDPQGLRAGALWHDAYLTSPSRLMIEMLHWASSCGASMLNYVEAVSLIQDSNRVQGVLARDVQTRTEYEFRAPIVVNCAGPWSRQVAARFDREMPELFRPSVGVNLLIRRKPTATCMWAVTSRRQGGGTYFLGPLDGMTLAGTYHATWHDVSLTEPLPDSVLHSFIDDLNSAVPGFALEPNEVERVLWGFLPARATGSRRQAITPIIRNHASAGGPRGLFSVSGVKLTTARHVAEECLSTVLMWSRKPMAPVRDLERPGSEPVPTATEVRDLLAGQRHERIRQTISRLIDREAVVRPSDLWLRRTEWGLDPALRRHLEEAVGPALVPPESPAAAPVVKETRGIG